jgi:hypothetical protein
LTTTFSLRFQPLPASTPPPTGVRLNPSGRP